MSRTGSGKGSSMRVRAERLEQLAAAYQKKHTRASRKLARFCVLDELAANLSNEKYFALMQQHGISEDDCIKLNEQRTNI